MIIHPEVKHALLFIPCRVVPNLCDFLSSLEHKIYFEGSWFSETFLKISSFMFHRRKSVIQVWKDMLVNNRIFIFGWTTLLWIKYCRKVFNLFLSNRLLNDSCLILFWYDKKKHPFFRILYFKDNFVKYKYYDHKCVVHQTPASGVSFSHIKPAEVPDSTTLKFRVFYYY